MTTALTLPDTLTQSLATGAPGRALLAVEHALTGVAPWKQAQQALRDLALAPIDASEHAGLYYGAPAIAFVLAAASGDGHPRGSRTLSRLDGHVERLTHRRLTLAWERRRTGAALRFGDYDLFYGLTGLGAHLLHRNPASGALAGLLEYVVGLVRPRTLDDGAVVPGWWVDHDPDTALATPGGHANLGMAHGAAGLLALLGSATRNGVVVNGQLDAIETLQAFYDQWRHDGPDGPWWPHWLTRDALRTGRVATQNHRRPSWCYGAPGIARAQQIAAIATRDHHRRASAEKVLAACLTARHVARLTAPGLCHGLAGLYQTAYRAAADAADPTLTHHLPTVADALTHHAATADPSFLTGQAGIDLALNTLRTGQPPATGWDTCLLIS
ncbi:hypothetical protein GCM10027059_14190 [Myceligenerans halotolerans]